MIYYVTIAAVIFSCVKIFTRAHLLFHWCLCNKHLHYYWYDTRVISCTVWWERIIKWKQLTSFHSCSSLVAYVLSVLIFQLTSIYCLVPFLWWVRRLHLLGSKINVIACNSDPSRWRSYHNDYTLYFIFVVLY